MLSVASAPSCRVQSATTRVPVSQPVAAESGGNGLDLVCSVLLFLILSQGRWVVEDL